MGKFSGCVLACDIDGTLVSNGILPERNVEKIKDFVAEGGTFALATGRGRAAVGMVTDTLKEYIGASVVANGCEIYDFSKDKEIYGVYHSEKLKKAICEVSEKFKNAGMEIHLGRDVYCVNQNSETDVHQEYEGFAGIDCRVQDMLDVNWNKLLFAAEEFRWCEQVLEFLETQTDDFYAVRTNAVIYGKERNYLEILPKGANKASALLKLCEILNIKKGGYFAIGDFYNDLQMLKAADISACPHDSPEEVMRETDYKTCKVLDGAVADFIEYLEKNYKGE